MIKFDPEGHNLFDPWVLIATFGGVGFLKPAPGTWGSLAAIPIALLDNTLLGLHGFLFDFFIILCIGTYAAGKFDALADSKDNKCIVIDEVAGQYVALFPLFAFKGMLSDSLFALLVVLSFILFRAFDIVKPWPISIIDQKMEGAIAVMLDDLVAGLFVCIILWGVLLYV